MKQINKTNAAWLLILLLGTLWILARHNQPVPFQQDNGLIFGTVYKVTYQHKQNLKDDIEAALRRFDGSLSMFNDTSTISRINRNQSVATDSLFLRVFRRSMEISAETDGAFDITVAPLVNAWGFGFKKNALPGTATVDSLMEVIGYQKVHLAADGQIRKDDPRIMLDCSAIAKGYAVDVIADLLHAKGIGNYMVEIGGEVVVRGTNPSGSAWHIGINKPVEDSLSINQDLQTVLSITGRGIATSGNYRNFYYKGGKRYAHTIDPHTGYPVEHNLLSATVIASCCMDADAYATSFMVMGLERAKTFIANHADLDAYLIYSDGEGNLQTYFSEGMRAYLQE